MFSLFEAKSLLGGGTYGPILQMWRLRPEKWNPLHKATQLRSGETPFPAWPAQL